jgi:integrase
MDEMKQTVVQLKQPKAERVTLTKARVEAAPARARRYMIADAAAPGLVLQIEPSGARALYFRGSIGKGRVGRIQIMARIGDPASVSLAEARDTTARWAAMARAGVDPRGDSTRATVAVALDRYEASLQRRQVVKAPEVMSSLRRGLAAHLKRTLDDLDRAAIAAAITRMEASGATGAAAYLRKSASAFMGWAEAEGLVTANPLLGWRRAASTRAQRLDAAGQWTPVGADALRRVWHAFDAATDDRFAVFLRLLLLTGLRKAELATARWSDVDLDVGVITIRPERAKTGVGRVHPLGPVSRLLLADLPRLVSPEGYIFPGRTGAPLSGWSQRLAPVRAAAGEQVEPHGLRRAYRSGLSELGVSFDIAELMIGHKRPGLHGLYDHSTLDAQRAEAQARWEHHLSAIVG